jgi:hypothetical protein
MVVSQLSSQRPLYWRNRVKPPVVRVEALAMPYREGQADVPTPEKGNSRRDRRRMRLAKQWALR